MQTFKDGLDEEWHIVLDIPAARMLRKALGLDILRPDHAQQVRSSLLDRLSIAYLLCEKLAKERKVDADEFERRLFGDGIADGASNAVMEELTLFFQSLGQNDEAMRTRYQLEIQIAGQKKSAEFIATGQADSMMKRQRDEILSTLDAIVGNGLQNSMQSAESESTPKE